eukprot:2632955-Rhodomonas_salina.2
MFTAVASSAAVRLVISVTIGLGQSLHQLDVVGAYFCAPLAPLAEDLAMWEPKGICKHNRECWALLAHLYCGREAGAAWKNLFKELLI